MKYFLDAEFNEYKKKPLFSKGIDTIELISIGVVAEDNREYYAVSKDFDLKAAWNNDWLRDNVLLSIYTDNIGGDMRNHNPFEIHTMKWIINGIGKTNKQIATDIRLFTQYEFYKVSNDFVLGNDVIEAAIKNNRYKPEFYGYYSDYDWVVFCWLFGRMMDLPKGFPMYCKDLQQMKDGALLFRSDVRNIEDYTDYPEQANEHNALADAKWNKRLFEFLNKL